MALPKRAARPERTAKTVRARDSHFVFINAATAGRGAVESMREKVAECFEQSETAGETGGARLVIFNVSAAMIGNRHSRLKNRKMGLRRLGEELCYGFNDKALVDYCHRNVALFDVGPPSKDQLPRKFFSATLEKLLFGRKKAPMADSAHVSFRKVSPVDEASTLDDVRGETALRQLDWVRGKIRALEKEARRRLEAK